MLFRESNLKPERLIRVFFFIVGILSTVIAAIGIILPLIPTTPLLLLSVYCFARSSQRFYIWLTTNRLFGVYIQNYREGKGIRLNHKFYIIIMLWLTIIWLFRTLNG